MSPAQQLGPYRLIECIGRGGMGEVWKARDTRLDREVAVKISAEQFSDRFEREARAIAALNHPNICTLFDVGPNYLVMELIDGPTLADRIAEGPIPLEEVLAIARQIADALEAAHEKNIVHRDLKPGNIKVRSDGSVKVLDFGLAKAGLPGAEVSHDSPTLVHSPTMVGVILGTAAYMAPEQARGKVVDKRADIWSFGVVLHEMLTGKRTFEGEDLTETLASVVKSDPDLTVIPHKIRRLLAKCLQKEPKKRLRDIGDAWELLDDSHASATALSRSRLRIVWPVMAGVFAAIAATVSFLHFREKPPEAPVTRFIITPPPNTAFQSNNMLGDATPALSPDGRKLVFQTIAPDGKRQLWLRPLDSLAAQPLAGTEGGFRPFWSPDGKSIGFFSGGKLQRIDVAGGPAITLADDAGTGGAGGTWNPQGVILFSRPDAGVRGSLYRIPAAGGSATPATRVEAEGAIQAQPWFLPGGKNFLFVQGFNGNYALRAGSLGSPESRALGVSTNSRAIYASGYLLFLRAGTLMAQPFDADRLATTGEAVPPAERVPYSNFSVSANGTLVYLETPGLIGAPMAWYDRQGKKLGDLGDPAIYTNPALSPDGKRLAVGVGALQSRDIWVFDLTRGVPTRFTFDPKDDLNPAWSPDGSHIAFTSNRTGPRNIYRKASNGTGPEELLMDSREDKAVEDWSPDGKFIVYSLSLATFRIWAVPAEGERKPFPILNAAGFAEQYSRISPDGHWIAYRSTESGRPEIFVQSFPPSAGKWQISSTGGDQPSWRGDGKELFFRNGTKIMAVDIQVSGAGIEAGLPHVLFDVPDLTPLLTRNSYVATPDGQRFLVCVAQPNSDNRLTAVQNWTSLLKK